MSNLFTELAMEAGIIEGVETDLPDARPISEIILEDSEQEQPLEVLKHARDAREIAEDLDELADRAEKLAEEDEGGVHGTISVESMHREYLTIMKANKLNFNAFSFEAAGTVDGQILGLRDDARRTALDLRNAAESMEAGVSRFKSESANDAGLFENKNKSIKKAADSLQVSASALTHVKITDEVKSVPVPWDTVFTFMQQKGQPIKDISVAFKEEKSYLDGVEKYLETSIANLGNVKTENDTVKEADDKLVNTGPAKSNTPGDFPLLGSEGVFDFTLRTLPDARWPKWDNFRESRKTYILATNTKAFVGLGVALATISAAPFFSIASSAYSMLQSGKSHNALFGKEAQNESEKVSVVPFQSVESIVKFTLDLAKDSNDKLDALLSRADAEISRIKELGNKDAVKAAQKVRTNMKNAIAIYKHRVWYITTRTARLAESAARASK